MAQDINLIDQALKIAERQHAAEQERKRKEAADRTERENQRKRQLEEFTNFTKTSDAVKYGKLLQLTGRRVVLSDSCAPGLTPMGSIILLVDEGTLVTKRVYGLKNHQHPQTVDLKESGIHSSNIPWVNLLDEWVRSHALPIPNLVEYINEEMTKIAQEIVDEDKKRQRSSEDV